MFTTDLDCPYCDGIMYVEDVNEYDDTITVRCNQCRHYDIIEQNDEGDE